MHPSSIFAAKVHSHHHPRPEELKEKDSKKEEEEAKNAGKDEEFS